MGCKVSPMKEREQRFPRRIGRRRVLKTAAVTSAVVAVGGAVVEAVRTWQALHPSRIQYDLFLAATATAASEQGLATTLRPDGPFTREMIQTVLRNTGFVLLKLTDNTTIGRSAYLVQGQGDLYIVTSVHRPFLGNAVGSKEIPQDVALIGVPQAPFSSLEVPADGMPIRDDFIPSSGDPVLFAGYPNEFHAPNLLRSITQGSVSHITDTERDQPYTWGFTGLAALGSSGGPVCALVNGQLTGVGVTTQTKAYFEEVMASSIPLSTLRTALAV